MLGSLSCPANEPAKNSQPHSVDLPLRVRKVLDKFVQFEKAAPTTNAWQAKRRDVLRFLTSVFDTEASKANLEGAVAIRDAAKNLKARRYLGAKATPALAGVARESRYR
jgi:hypothetical protein